MVQRSVIQMENEKSQCENLGILAWTQLTSPFVCDKRVWRSVMGGYGRHQVLPVSAARMRITQILLVKVNGLFNCSLFLIPAALLNMGLTYLFLGVV